MPQRLNGPTRPTHAALALLLAAAIAAPALGQSLQSRFDQTVRAMDVGDAAIAYHVIDLADGLAVAGSDGERAMIPASNMKLLTTAAAAMVLEPEFTFVTRMARRDHDLVIIGDGDPAFGDPKILKAMGLDVEDMLARWVKVVERSGMKRIDRLWIDDRIFDHKRVHPNWPADQLDNWYCAPVAGLNFNNNCLEIFVTPTDLGQAPRIATRPLKAPVIFNNLARTTRKGAPWAERDPQTRQIAIKGKVGRGIKRLIYLTLDDPPMMFGRVFADRLEDAGIAVGEIRRVTDSEQVAGALPIAEVRTPLAEVMGRCNRDSQNLFAEALIKRLGHEATGDPGSWSSGAAAIRMFLSRTIGPDAAKVVVDDGSGMSRDNRISPKMLTRILRLMHRAEDDLAEMYLDSLAEAGEGTLRRRFRGRDMHGEVYAKSGYIRGVIALSGYVIHDDQHAYAFSIILNDWAKPIGDGKKLIDRMVIAIDEHLAEAASRDQQSVVEEPAYGGEGEPAGADPR